MSRVNPSFRGPDFTARDHRNLSRRGPVSPTMNLFVVDFLDPGAEPIKVTVQEGDDLTDLKEKILAQWGSRGLGLAPGDLRLWKVRHCNAPSPSE